MSKHETNTQVLEVYPLDEKSSEQELDWLENGGFVSREYPVSVMPETDDASQEAVLAKYDVDRILEDPRLQLTDQQLSIMNDYFGFPEEGKSERTPMTRSQIAEKYGITPDAVKKELDSITEELRLIASGELDIPESYNASTDPGKEVLVDLGLPRGPKDYRPGDGLY